jgi:hypothetical protein
VASKAAQNLLAIRRNGRRRHERPGEFLRAEDELANLALLVGPGKVGDQRHGSSCAYVRVQAALKLRRDGRLAGAQSA